MNLKAACTKFKIEHKTAVEIIAAHHEIEHMMTKAEKKKLVKVNCCFRGDSLDRVKQIGRALNVTQDAVILGCLRLQVAALEKDNYGKHSGDGEIGSTQGT